MRRWSLNRAAMTASVRVSVLLLSFYDRSEPIEEGEPDHLEPDHLELRAGERYDLENRRRVNVF